jgi:superfamily II DNA/RNA helicase
MDDKDIKIYHNDEDQNVIDEIEGAHEVELADLDQVLQSQNDGNNVLQSDEVLPETIDDFEEMTFLTMELARGIHRYGFKRPSPIQSKTIHVINSGCDLIAQSQSGTGKTGAFTIGALSRINVNENFPQVLIIVHTRTLATQIVKVVENLTHYMKINISLCIGGEKNKTDQNIKTTQNAHILIGTPGRICELIKKRAFNPINIKTLIMDEADELLKDDFRDQIVNIITSISKTTQICIFSATFTPDILRLTENFMNDPYRITIQKEDVSLDLIKQYNIDVREERYKFDTLKDLNKKLCISQMIIFVNSVPKAIKLRNTMIDDGFDVGLVHGKMNNSEREEILRQFRLGETRTLISTDVMSRGIDIDDLKIVINYDIATDNESYIHRIGRSGRFGSQGVAINFCTYDDRYRIKSIERHYGITIPVMPIPDTINEYLTGIKSPDNKVCSSNNYR